MADTKAEPRRALDGVLAVTTYPLFLRNQHWTHYQLNGGQPRRLQFPSSLSQGIYNPARALLLQELGRLGSRHEDELLEYFAPSVDEKEAEAGDRPGVCHCSPPGPIEQDQKQPGAAA